MRDKKPSLINFYSLESNENFLFHFGCRKLQVSVTPQPPTRKERQESKRGCNKGGEIARQPDELSSKAWQVPLGRRHCFTFSTAWQEEGAPLNQDRRK